MTGKAGGGMAAKIGGGLGIACVLVVFAILAREGRQAPVALDDLEAAPHGLGRVRVEVLNAGGVAGRARLARDEARAAGFDVVYFGNADSWDRDSSVVLDRVGDIEMARAVAKALRIREVRSEPDPNLFLDVSVMLGSTWTPVEQSR